MLEGEIYKNMHGMEKIYHRLQYWSRAVSTEFSFSLSLFYIIIFSYSPYVFLSRVNVQKCFKMKNSCINFVINLSWRCSLFLHPWKKDVYFKDCSTIGWIKNLPLSIVNKLFLFKVIYCGQRSKLQYNFCNVTLWVQYSWTKEMVTVFSQYLCSLIVEL